MERLIGNEIPTIFGSEFPNVYSKESPPEMDYDYMANPGAIRKRAIERRNSAFLIYISKNRH